MSSSRIDNSGHFHSEGFQLIGNNFTTNGGSIYINASSQQPENKIDLDKLKFVKEAAFDAYEQVHQECHANTRVDLLREIQDWTIHHESQNVFWLQGMAGTGKSTVSYTIAKWLCEQGLSHGVNLGASFFFKRGEGDRGSAAFLFPTIAYQLARKLPGLGVLVARAIEDDPDICNKALGEQFKTLIREPITKLSSDTYDKTHIIVVDALDECRTEDIDVVLRLWLHDPPLGLKMFLTSRPDLPIRLRFNKTSANIYQELILHDIPRHQVQQDILTFLRDKFAFIRQEYDEDYFEDEYSHEEWPGEEILQKLTDIAVPLFIVAATIYRFVNDHLQDPLERLQLVLHSQRKIGEMSPIATTYLPVLQQLHSPKSNLQDQEGLYANFRTIVGSIITLVQPLSQAALADLLSVPKKPLSLHLRLFSSVFHIPALNSDAPVRPLHLSFAEFLTGEEIKGQPFSIDIPATHGMLMTKCLALLSRSSPNGLCENMCGLSYPGQSRQDITSEVIQARLPSAVQYACQYWTYHAQNGRKQIIDNDVVHEFLQRHFLHWLEALGLLDRIADAITHIETLQSLLANKSHNSVSVTTFLEDARRFVLSYRYIVNIAPLQLYSSAIAFSPQESIVRKVCGRMPDWILQSAVTSKMWGPELQQLEGHTTAIMSLTFSPDGRQLASGSSDGTVRLWDTKTGQEVQKFGSYDDETIINTDSGIEENINKDIGAKPIITVAFSLDGSQLAAAAVNGAFLWDTKTRRGKHQKSTELIRVAALSPSFRHLASTYFDDYPVVRLIDIGTGQEIKKLEGHTTKIQSIAFSSDSRHIVSGSDHGTIRLWDAETGQEILKFAGHDFGGVPPGRTPGVVAVAFSPEGRLLASGSMDRTVRVWDVETGEEIMKLGSPEVLAVAFSPDGRRLALGSMDRTVRVCDIETGQEIAKLEGHTASVSTVAFSPDGEKLASGSADTIIRLWDMKTRQAAKHVVEYTRRITSVAFSRDGRQLAAGSFDGTIQLWDVETGKLVLELEKEHYRSVDIVTFSNDGRQLITCCSLREKRWDTKTGQAGPVGFRSVYSSSPIDLGPSSSESSQADDSDYLGIEDDWIRYRGKRLLWLPPTYRPYQWAAHGEYIALGRTGLVTVLRLRYDMGEIPPLQHDR